MKKIWIYILLCTPLISCNDFLDVEPEQSVTFTNYFKNEKDLQALVVNMFTVERDVYAPLEATLHEIIGLKCDEINTIVPEFNGNMAQQCRELDPGIFMNERLDVRHDWKSYYDIVYLANVLIDNRYRFEGVTAERADFWIGQACFAKAMAYFRIAQIWGDAPIVPDSEYQQSMSKSPAKAVLEEALRSAEKALGLPLNNDREMMDANGKAITSRQYASRGTVYTLMANIYAWMGGIYGDRTYWEEAEKCASKVIEGEAGRYALEPIETLCTNTLGNGRQSDETIFAIEISSIDRNYFDETATWNIAPGNMLVTYPVTTADGFNDVVSEFISDGGSGDVKARIRHSTVERLYREEGDKRINEFWKDFGTEKNTPKIHEEDPFAYLYKWRTAIYSIKEESENFLGVEGNRVIWRLADLILLRAECRTRLESPAAVDDLNAVRLRAGLSAYTGNTNPERLRMEVFYERERELFGEGQRYYDAVRNGYYRELTPAMAALTETDIANGAIYLPVSQGAFTENDLMRQNTYWLWKK